MVKTPDSAFIAQPDDAGVNSEFASLLKRQLMRGITANATSPTSDEEIGSHIKLEILVI